MSNDLKNQTNDKLVTDKIDFFLIGVKYVKKFGIFDTTIIQSSIQDMLNYLFYYGYFESTITYSVVYETIKIKKTRIPACQVIYSITLGSQKTVDSFNNNMSDSILRNVVEDIKKSQFIKKGDFFSYKNTDELINKIHQGMQNRGFLNFNKNEILVILDTLNTSKPNSINMQLKNIPVDDSSSRLQYLIRNIIYEVKTNTVEDLPFQTKTFFYKQVNVLQPKYFINPKIFWLCNSMDKGSILRLENITSSIQSLYNTNIWSNITIENRYIKDTFINQKKHSIVDFYAIAQPQKKYKGDMTFGLNFNNPINASASTSGITSRTTSTSANFSYQIRNFIAQGVLLYNSFQVGVELNLTDRIFTDPVRTLDLSFSSTAEIPGLMFLNNLLRFNKQHSLFTSSITVSFFNTERITYYFFQSFGTSFGWKYKYKNSWEVELKPLNLTLNYLTKYLNFQEIEKTNPLLNLIFNDGITAGLNLSIKKYFHYRSPLNKTNIIFNIEESNTSWGRLAFPDNSKLFTYIKVYLSATHALNLYKNSLHFRVNTGVGISVLSADQTIPFFKQFFVGGVNSMRGWNIGQLGLGSSTAQSTSDLQDKRGDVYFETNMEHRIYLIEKPKSYRIETALFVDMGNIWNRNLVAGESENSVFATNRFFTDLGIAAGMGLRFILGDIFTIRFDYGYRIKDPIFNSTQDGWFHPSNMGLTAGQLLFGIGYPF